MNPKPETTQIIQLMKQSKKKAKKKNELIQNAFRSDLVLHS